MTRIGLLIQDIESEYSNSIIKGVRKYCLENNIQLFIFIVRSKNWSSGAFEYQHIGCKALATKHNVDGLILVTNTYCQNLPREKHEKLVKEFNYVPLVSFGVDIPDISSVYGNSEKSFRTLLEHLDQIHSCKNIAFMGPKSNSEDIVQRFQVYKDFKKSKNQNIDNCIYYADYSYEAAILALRDYGITKENLPFDALVCCNDDLAFGCMDYCREKGIHVPEDLKITGFDNQLRCDYTKPPLTSIDMRIEEQCYEAAKILHSEIKNDNYVKEDCCIDSRIEFRESCGCSKSEIKKESAESKYFNLREQVYSYQYFLQDLQATVEPEAIIDVLKSKYKSFGIESCICCLYDEPKIMFQNEDLVLPERAKIYFAYNKQKDYEYGDDFFINPAKNLYPVDFSFEPGKDVIVTVLFDHEYQYGYLVYTTGEMSYNTYELIVSITSISLATNIVFFEKVRENNKLISEKKSLETETYFDEMTGTMNRRGLYKFAKPAITSALERGLTGGVIFGDMDHLKKINDTYGHEAGDRAIKGEVEILKSVFRTQDIIARIGGDEFIIVACGLDPKAFEKIKVRIAEEAVKYNESHDEPFTISISLGYVEFTKDNCYLDELIRKADIKQYEEKMRHHEK